MPRRNLVIILAKSKAEGYRYARRADIPARYFRIPLRGSQVKGVRVADIHMLPSFQTSPHRHSILSALRRVRGHGVKLDFYDVEMPPAPEKPIESADWDELTPDQRLEQQFEYLLGRPELESTHRPTSFKLEVVDDDVEVPEHHTAMVEQVLGDRQVDWDAQGDPLVDLEAAAEAVARESELLTELAEVANNPEVDEAVQAKLDHNDEALDAIDDAIDGEQQEDPEAPTKRRRSRCPDCGELRFPDDHTCEALEAKKSPRERLTGEDFF